VTIRTDGRDIGEILIEEVGARLALGRRVLVPVVRVPNMKPAQMTKGPMRFSRILTIATVAACLVTPSQILAEAINLECTILAASNEDGRMTLDEPFILKFAYDNVMETAVLIGNNGVANVTPLRGDDKITFVEVTPTGTVQTTTIAGSGAVHSRNSVIGGQIAASQYYGSCVGAQ
jgi:hypothetical protein